jgi:hypothetical protein
MRTPFANLEDSATGNGFIAWFAGASREQVGAVLGHTERSLTAA